MLRCYGVQLSKSVFYAQMTHTHTDTHRRMMLKCKKGLSTLCMQAHAHAHTQIHTPSPLDNHITSGLFGFQDISLAAQKSTAAQLEALKIKYEESVELRKKAELDIEAFRPVGSSQIDKISLIIKSVCNPLLIITVASSGRRQSHLLTHYLGEEAGAARSRN